MNILLGISCTIFNTVSDYLNRLKIGKYSCTKLELILVYSDILYEDNACGSCLSDEDKCLITNELINLIL